MGFSRQEYWSGVPLPSPEIHPKDIRNTKKKKKEIQKNFTVLSVMILLVVILILFRNYVMSVYHKVSV